MATFSAVTWPDPAGILQTHTYPTSHKTGVIIGIPHSGTSMITAVVDKLGLPAGNKASWNFEIQGERPSALDDFESWKSTLISCNAEMNEWSFKDPAIFRFPTGDVHAIVRNPYYVIVTRDTSAIVQREAESFPQISSDHMRALLERIVKEQSSMWQWINSLPDAPKLLVSYERALRDRSGVCRIVSRFFGITPSPEEIVEATNRIGLTGGYLKSD